MLDHTGVGLGAGIGLVELGHTVRYAGPQPAPMAAGGELASQRRQLIGRYFGAEAEPDGRADLLVIAGSFADQLLALQQRRHLGQPFDPDALRRATWNPLVYPHRLRWWLELVSTAPAVAVIDGSDAQAPREAGFESLPHATLLAREVDASAPSAWRPWPFLYNPVLLWLECLQPEPSWLLPAQRHAQRDWVFCGTLQHPRYGGRRARLLAEVQRRWPRGIAASSVSFLDVLQLLQQSRCGLDLPGAGELCFRLHECLALGVPVLRPWPFAIALPPGLDGAFAREPAAAPSFDEVRAIYRERYAPRAAAEALLAAVVQPSGAGAG